MKQRIHQTVRNDALRLTLSRQEGQYIQEQLTAARQSLKTLAIIAATGGFLLAVLWLFTDSSYYFRLEFGNPEHHSYLRIFSHIAGVGAGIVTFVAVLKIPFAWLNVAKYESYRTEHNRFLDGYNRPQQDGSRRA